jgi:hypothetical protein
VKHCDVTSGQAPKIVLRFFTLYRLPFRRMYVSAKSAIASSGSERESGDSFIHFLGWHHHQQRTSAEHYGRNGGNIGSVEAGPFCYIPYENVGRMCIGLYARLSQPVNP